MSSGTRTQLLASDLGTDIGTMLSFPFMQNALLASAVVAVVGGVVGYFVVLRRQSYAAHTLSLAGFPGAAGAVLLGVSATVGFLVFCVVGALLLALLDFQQRRSESAVVATVQVGFVALGSLFGALYSGLLGNTTNLLFGSITGITRSDVILLSVVGSLVVVIIAVIHRRLYFATVDPVGASASGVPVGALSTAFLMVLGIAVSQAAQIAGVLLVFSLLVTPAATAQTLTTTPVRALWLGAGLSLAIAWVGVTTAFFTDLPVGFVVTSLAFVLYVISQLSRLRTAR